MYYLRDLNGDKINWSFYSEDLTKVDEDNLNHFLVVDKILKEKTEDGIKLYLVTFKYQSKKLSLIHI